MEVTYDPRHGTLEIGGVDVSPAVRRVTFDAHVGRQPDVFVELRQGVVTPDVLTAEGVVHVVRDGDTNPALAAAMWLRTLDPSMIEGAVLDSMDMSIPTGQAFLNVLVDLAEKASG